MAETAKVKLWPRMTICGEVYNEVVYMEHDASRVKFTHASGVANMPISELPSSLQKELDYEPSKAAANEAKLASEQHAIREQVQADAASARSRAATSANSSGQPEEKDGMIRVVETEIIPPDEVQRLGIAGLQKYRQPDESPLEQLDREKKTGVIRKVWKWVPIEQPEVRKETPQMKAAKAQWKLHGEQQKALFDQKLGLKRQHDSVSDPNQKSAIMKQINAVQNEERVVSQQKTIQERLMNGRDAQGNVLPDWQR
jgi:hypothetical protein